MHELFCRHLLNELPVSFAFSPAVVVNGWSWLASLDCPRNDRCNQRHDLHDPRLWYRPGFLVPVIPKAKTLPLFFLLYFSLFPAVLCFPAISSAPTGDIRICAVFNHLYLSDLLLPHLVLLFVLSLPLSV